MTKLIQEQLTQWYHKEEEAKDLPDVRHTPLPLVRPCDQTSSRQLGPNHLAVIVSAIGGVTNTLDLALKNAANLHKMSNLQVASSMVIKSII